MPAKKHQITWPVFTLGTYRAMDGTAVPFDDDLLKALTKNTNHVIDKGILLPPVSLVDHPAYKGKGPAHGHISRAFLKDHVLSVVINQPSKQLREWIRDGKILTRSPEFDHNFTVPDVKGVDQLIGPTIMGLAPLGAGRGAIKHEKIVPVGSIPFAEGVSAEDAEAARAELGRQGFVAAGYDGDVIVFSEMSAEPLEFGEDHEIEDSVIITANRNGLRGKKCKIMAIREGTFYAVETEDDYPGIVRWLASDEVVADDGASFSENDEEHDMTDAEIQALITKSVEAATKPLAEQNAALQTQIKAFSETSRTEADTNSFCETVEKEKKSLPKLSLGRAKDILNDPELTTNLRAKFKAFVEGLPPVLVPAGVATPKGPKDLDDDNTDIEDANEPTAITRLRPAHFSDPERETQVAAAVVKFGEWKPEAFKDVKGELDKWKIVERHVIARESAANAN